MCTCTQPITWGTANMLGFAFCKKLPHDHEPWSWTHSQKLQMGTSQKKTSPVSILFTHPTKVKFNLSSKQETHIEPEVKFFFTHQISKGWKNANDRQGLERVHLTLPTTPTRSFQFFTVLLFLCSPRLAAYLACFSLYVLVPAHSTAREIHLPGKISDTY